MDVRSVLKNIALEKSRILVVGLGISGVETARFLAGAGYRVATIERTEEERFLRASKYRDAIADLRKLGVESYFGVDGEGAADLFESVRLAVLSPGVALESAICGALKRRSIPWISEIELGLELLQLPSVIVTGSNGKSTTVSLVHQMLKDSGFDSRLCGNVGIPVVADLTRDHIFEDLAPGKKVLVVEASSYQLESCLNIKPRVAALLNISDNHLERHGTLQRYFEAKARLFANQDSGDFAILNADDALVASLAPRVRSQVAFFGTKDLPAGSRFGAVVGDADISVRIDGKQEHYTTGKTRLLGAHNRLNIAAALLGARLLGAAPEALQRTLENFSPLEHRLEFLQLQGLPLYINDSKSTTVAASVAALRSVVGSFPERKITLMIGGLAKAGSWEPLFSLITEFQNQLHRTVCFGKDGNILANHCRRYSLPYVQAASLADGVAAAAAQSSPDDVILLSPGCASFDEFSDFEERGTVFKSIVRSL